MGSREKGRGVLLFVSIPASAKPLQLLSLLCRELLPTLLLAGGFRAGKRVNRQGRRGGQGAGQGRGCADPASGWERPVFSPRVWEHPHPSSSPRALGVGEGCPEWEPELHRLQAHSCPGPVLRPNCTQGATPTLAKPATPVAAPCARNFRKSATGKVPNPPATSPRTYCTRPLHSPCFLYWGVWQHCLGLKSLAGFPWVVFLCRGKLTLVLISQYCCGNSVKSHLCSTGSWTWHRWAHWHFSYCNHKIICLICSHISKHAWRPWQKCHDSYYFHGRPRFIHLFNRYLLSTMPEIAQTLGTAVRETQEALSPWSSIPVRGCGTGSQQASRWGKRKPRKLPWRGLVWGAEQGCALQKPQCGMALENRGYPVPASPLIWAWGF